MKPSPSPLIAFWKPVQKREEKEERCNELSEKYKPFRRWNLFWSSVLEGIYARGWRVGESVFYFIRFRPADCVWFCVWMLFFCLVLFRLFWRRFSIMQGHEWRGGEELSCPCPWTLLRAYIWYDKWCITTKSAGLFEADKTRMDRRMRRGGYLDGDAGHKDQTKERACRQRKRQKIVINRTRFAKNS